MTRPGTVTRSGARCPRFFRRVVVPILETGDAPSATVRECRWCGRRLAIVEINDILIARTT